MAFKINAAGFFNDQLRHLLFGIVPNAHARLWRGSWLRENCSVARVGHLGLDFAQGRSTQIPLKSL